MLDGYAFSVRGKLLTPNPSRNPPYQCSKKSCPPTPHMPRVSVTGPNSLCHMTIADQAESVLEDVARITAHPLVPSGIPVYGYIYDVTGCLIEVPAATAAGSSL